MTPAAIMRAGLSDQNPGLVQLLGLCPLLAISTSLASGLGLGLATLAVLTASNVAASLVGRALPAEIRIAVFVVLIAALVTAVELALAAWVPALHAALGIFLPLIVTNCLLLARAEAFASRQSLPHAALDGIAMGGGFLLVLVTLGSVRELLGRGSLGADFAALFGLAGRDFSVHLFDERHGLLFALLPPGAFILLGLMVAAHNARRAARTMQAAASAPVLSPALAARTPDMGRNA
jgi:electron transport complex protein RnfE